MSTQPRIFLIEDEPDIAFMYQTLLAKQGYDITVARDGEQAWQLLMTEEAPDLLLLDVVLPKKDGFEILRDLRKDKRLHHLQVVLLTNLAQDVDRREGKKLGATEYIVKAHTDPHELAELVKKYVGDGKPNASSDEVEP